MPPRSHSRPISAAIDFGTTYSGYAFSLKNDTTRVQCNQSWIAGSRALVSLKTPTCVLLNADKTFNSFGYEAENTFANLAEDKAHQNMYFFFRFKMALYENKTLSRKTLLKDLTGKKTMRAIDIFAMSIKYMKDHLLNTLNRRFQDINVDDIQFVVTVPAIWDDTAKIFMRAAALEAGISGEQLTLALESEAASIWCQHVPTQVDRVSEYGEIVNLPTNSKYMVVDLGGGTADITVHVLKEDKTLREVHKASGGAWGGSEVDKAFVKLIMSIVGMDAMQAFMKEQVIDFLDLFREFETKKRTITHSTKGNIMIKMPLSLRTYSETGGKNLDQIIKDSYLKDRVSWMGDKLRIDATLIRGCFEVVICKIISHVKSILDEPYMRDVSTILMAGGFSDCALLQEEFKTEFQEKRKMNLLVPGDGCVLVLKGAVLHGHDPGKVSSRIARHTYGLAIVTEFDPEKHPAEKKSLSKDGKPLCLDVFWKAVEVGEEIPVGHRVSRVGKPADKNQQEIQHDIYRSTSACPQFVTDSGCEKIGSIRCPLPEGNSVEDKLVDEILFFGQTELSYVVRHRTTGKEFKYDIDSL